MIETENVRDPQVLDSRYCVDSTYLCLETSSIRYDDQLISARTIFFCFFFSFFHFLHYYYTFFHTQKNAFRFSDTYLVFLFSLRFMVLIQISAFYLHIADSNNFFFFGCTWKCRQNGNRRLRLPWRPASAPPSVATSVMADANPSK